MDEVIEFDLGPYRNRKVVKPDSSPGGLGWYCLPPSKTPSEMTPTPVWEPLLDVAKRLGITPNTLRNRVTRGTLPHQLRYARRGQQTMQVLYIQEKDVLPSRQKSPDGTRKPVIYQAAGHDGRAVTPTKGDRATVAERINHGATLLGITPEAYALHKEQGEHWCGYHKAWEPQDRFTTKKSRGQAVLHNQCREGSQAYSQDYYQRKKHAVV